MRLLVPELLHPMLIVMPAGGGITTYSLAGAQYGLGLLWLLIPITVVLIIIQEMCARMGVVSGKGLSDLIRERFGAKITFYLMIVLLLANLGNTF